MTYRLTPKEAIETIKCNYPPENYSMLREALDMAIEALQKQIPKSIVLEGDDCADGVMIYDTWICPSCGKHYELEYDDYDYCPNCGQALSWEDDE